jgi:hypothetical protein
MSQSQNHNQGYFTTGGLLPIGSSWRKAPWDPRLEFLFITWTFVVIVLKYHHPLPSAGSRQRSHSQVRVPRGSWPHFTVSDSTFLQPRGPDRRIISPFRRPPKTRSVEVLKPASTRDLTHDLILSLILRSTVSRPVCLGIKHPSGAYDQIFIVVRQLRACCYGVLSLTRGRVCRLQLLLVLASAVILGSESRWTRESSLFVASYDSQGYGGGIRSRLHTGYHSWRQLLAITYPRHRPQRKYHFSQFLCCSASIRCCWHVFVELLPSNIRFFWLRYSASQVSCQYIYSCMHIYAHNMNILDSWITYPPRNCPTIRKLLNLWSS